MSSRRGVVRMWLVGAAGLVLLIPLVVLAVPTFGGARLIRVELGPVAAVHVEDPLLWVILALLGALAAVTGWALTEYERRQLARETAQADETTTAAQERAREAEERQQETQAAQEQTEARLQEVEEQLEQVERERSEERQQHEAFAKAWRAERDWNRELRRQVAALQQQHGVLGHYDVREMILRLTIELTESEKGLLLSQPKDDSGCLRVVCAVGFEHDPADSALAHQLGRQVIERDQTVRIDDEGIVADERRTPADEEVRNLIAIPIYIRDDFHGVIVCANREDGFQTLDDEVLVAIGDHAGAVLENSRLHGELRNAYLQTVRTLSSVIEVKDPNLRHHSDAVAEYVLKVADELGFEPREREQLVFGALLHDVGKIGISERILLKPARLTDEEFSVMQLHPRIGYQLVRQIPALEPIALAILHHHERFDGLGYPARLRGELIPLAARVIGVADAFSAMTAERPYSAPLTVEHACLELERCAGGQFDPMVVELFVREVRRRPPGELDRPLPPPDPEIELHREPGAFVLGGSSFGLVDSLTLLYSHRHFHETARAAVQRASLQQRPFTMLVCRLDDLSRVNHEQGYGAGDRVLQSVADALRRSASSAGGVAFRISGRRVALIAPESGERDVPALVESLRRQLDAEITCSVGAAVWREGESAEQLFERAIRSAEPSGDADSEPQPQT